MTICVNHALINEKFPIILKNANVTPVHKKEDPADKKQISEQLVFCPYYKKTKGENRPII